MSSSSLFSSAKLLGSTLYISLQKMKLSFRFISAVALLFMLLVATGMGPVTAKARMCETSSQLFNGPCLSTTNCANICQNEGFPDGDCKGFRLRCICNRPC
ncbi:hypothetical protein HID58_002612 [Brassica napus]|uniref:Knottins-like domain-containing protein n=5 Tax=Brassica TaxID=3705 RepID=A0ABQ8EMX9_BRANA|nr:defensin-like protein 5 [Brassica napus]KAH0942975.1 hypothetical protein HID58_002612 [Brassica napus]